MRWTFVSGVHEVDTSSVSSIISHSGEGPLAINKARKENGYGVQNFSREGSTMSLLFRDKHDYAKCLQRNASIRFSKG